MNIYTVCFVVCLLLIATSQQDEGEMDDVGHGCLLSALISHDLLLHMAV